jgi:hypothetical protein
MGGLGKIGEDCVLIAGLCEHGVEISYFIKVGIL